MPAANFDFRKETLTLSSLYWFTDDDVLRSLTPGMSLKWECVTSARCHCTVQVTVSLGQRSSTSTLGVSLHVSVHFRDWRCFFNRSHSKLLLSKTTESPLWPWIQTVKNHCVCCATLTVSLCSLCLTREERSCFRLQGFSTRHSEV